MLRVMEREDYRDLLEKPSVFSHKYNRGVLGMLTGSRDYPGAALMSVRAALNTGGGDGAFQWGKTIPLRTLIAWAKPGNGMFHRASRPRACACLGWWQRYRSRNPGP